ncbi:MAG: twin-arginine translocase subunit TatC [Tannerella sp.]|jgi:sec-independent protein translocase protein TatC|nr:twin-arginine translocase subunit TatC [Tannerella sp.]
MSEIQDEMSFWDHLEELRWTLFRCIAALMIFAIGAFASIHYLFDYVILAPCSSDFILYRWMCKVSVYLPFFPDFCDQNFDVTLIQIKMATQFFTSMSTSFWIALLLTFPYLMYEVWKFVSPALYPHEQKSVRWVFFFGTIMFFIGCAVGYFLVFPMTFRFLMTYDLSSDRILGGVSLESYMDSFLMLIFIMGVIFEMPLLSWLLSKVGLLNRSFFRKYRRYAIVGLLVLAAFITPSGDPFTLAVVFFPLYGLYELSAFFVKEPPKEDDEEEEEFDDKVVYPNG